jgi:carbamoyltransferase
MLDGDWSSDVCSSDLEKSKNPLYPRLISAIHDLTGLGIVLNTSFNVKGEPIVMTPEDAVRCFYSTGMDALVMGRCLLKK